MQEKEKDAFACNQLRDHSLRDWPGFLNDVRRNVTTERWSGGFSEIHSVRLWTHTHTHTHARARPPRRIVFQQDPSSVDS